MSRSDNAPEAIQVVDRNAVNKPANILNQESSGKTGHRPQLTNCHDVPLNDASCNTNQKPPFKTVPEYVQKADDKSGRRLPSRLLIGVDHGLQQGQSTMVNTTFEGNDVFNRVPEVHPAIVPEFGCIRDIQGKLRFICQQSQQEPDLFLSNTQRFAIVAPKTFWQTIAEPSGCGANDFHVIGQQAGFLLQFTVHCLFGCFVAVHATLRKLPAIVTGSARPEYLAVIFHDDNRYIWPESVWVDHRFNFLGCGNALCDTLRPVAPHVNQFMPTAFRRKLLLTLLILSAASIILASAAGTAPLGWSGWLAAWQNPDSANGELIWRLRLPRALAAWSVGAMLALSGCLMQVLLRNPLADPYVLGVSGGAAFATLLGMTLGVAAGGLPFLALFGSLLSVLLVFGLARGTGPWSGTRLLLTGVVTASGWAALISLVLALSSDSSLRGMLFWLIGDLSYASMPNWALPVLVVAMALTMGFSRSLNVLSMGETTARLLGEPTHRLLWLVYVLASVLTATSVSIAGSIGFVGLIVPHLMRLLVGSDHRVLVPAAALFGGLFLVMSDTLARTVLAPRQLPVGVVTALLGVPLFLLLLNRARLRQ
jgi:iron complex transport system permease protein